MPGLERFRRALSSGRMEIDRIRRSKDNVDVTAVGLPARLPDCEMRVGERKASVVLFFEFVFGAGRIWIAPHPELANEFVALLVVAQPQKGLAFVWYDDPPNILIQPLFVLAAMRIEGQLLHRGALLRLRPLCASSPARDQSRSRTGDEQ